MTRSDHFWLAIQQYGGNLALYALEDLVCKQGLSHSEAARRVGIRASGISKLARERGMRGITPAGRKALSRARTASTVNGIRRWKQIEPVVAAMGPRVAARHLGMTPGQVAGLAHRARRWVVAP